MSQAMNQEVAPPRDGKLQKIAVTATAGVTELTENMLGMGWVRVKAIDADIDLLFGGEDVPALTFGGVGSSGVGYTIQAGTWEEFYISSNDTHVSWDASGAGTLILLRCGVERTGR